MEKCSEIVSVLWFEAFLPDGFDALTEVITCHHYSKTSCFGINNLPLIDEKDAFLYTKTTCFTF